ncbi:MAG: hypothetical protein QM817_29220 [Archangium sp.]
MRFPLILVLAVLSACDCGKPGVGDAGQGGGSTGGGTSGGGSATGAGGGSGGSGGGGGGACVAGASALMVAASTPVAAGSMVTLSASATVNGQSTDVTSSVTFTVTRDDDSPPGTVSGNAWTTAPGLGGTVHVTASDGCLSASTDVVVTFSGSISTGDGGVTTGDFGGTVDTTTSASLPRIVYPHDETRFPRNIYKVLFQWQRGGQQRFRLTFAGPRATVEVFTDGVSALCPTAACWEADAAAWLAIAGSNAGEEVTLTIDGTTAAGATVFRAAPIRLGFSRRDVKGAIFYWSTTSAGVRRATVSDSAPEPYVVGKPVGSLLSDGSRVQCVACHTVSRSGRKLFAGTQTSIDTGLFVYDVTLVAPPTPVLTEQISNRNKGFGTFSPDDQRVVATVGDQLAEFDSVTGMRFATLPVAKGTNPDWSPLGTELVFSNQGGDSPGAAALTVIERVDGGWGSTRTLVPVVGMGTSLFPSYAPDGLHIAYARGKGGHGDKTFQLWLIGSDGGTNTELLSANRKVNNCLGITCDALGMTNGQYENTMPTWAPPGDLDWVAFNSQRPYGVVYPNGGTQQILGRRGRSLEGGPASARRRPRRPELPGVPLRLSGPRREQPPRVLDARRAPGSRCRCVRDAGRDVLAQLGVLRRQRLRADRRVRLHLPASGHLRRGPHVRDERRQLRSDGQLLRPGGAVCGKRRGHEHLRVADQLSACRCRGRGTSSVGARVRALSRCNSASASRLKVPGRTSSSRTHVGPCRKPHHARRSGLQLVTRGNHLPRDGGGDECKSHQQPEPDG